MKTVAPNKFTKPELLAPAGDLEKLKVAIIYGADAVFIGGKEFSLRARASNFTIDDIKTGVEFAHKHNAKVYVTTNIIAHNENIEGLKDYLTALDEAGVDAIICADPYIISTAKSLNLRMEIHISTQQSITNSEAVNFWYDFGASRVVLARELSIAEIAQIRQKTKAELEVFIHGGMCVSYSGRCTLSNNMTDRDANRGGCAHSCRWNYRLYNKNNELLSKENSFYNLGSKDLMAVKYIPDLIRAGVDSLKIEGRMKTVHYIATVVGVYRKLIDDFIEDPDNFQMSDFYVEEIAKAESRLTSVGALSGKPTYQEQLYNVRSETPTQEFLGLVLDYDAKTQLATIEQRNHFKPGVEVEVYGPHMRKEYAVIDAIYDESFNLLDAARHPRQILKIKLPFKVEPYDLIRKVR
ncbi:MAG: U32 family peptidase [Bacilli bacterium]|nr:U32 family peptidase [Bacilli bacterium]